MAYRLDPELAPIAQMAQPLDLRDVATARKGMAAIAAQLAAAGATPRDERVQTEERRIPGPAGAPQVAIRIYRSKNATVPRPLMVYLHGGAFCLGDLDTEHARCLQICGELGFPVVSV